MKAKELTVKAAWNVVGDGIDGPSMRETRKPEVEHLVKDMTSDPYLVKHGVWFLYAGQDAYKARAVGCLAETVRNTMSGRADDKEELSRVHDLAVGFKAAFDLIAVPKDQLPRAVQRPNIFVFSDNKLNL